MKIFSIKYFDTVTGEYRFREIGVNADSTQEAFHDAVRMAYSEDGLEGRTYWETVESIALIAS